MSGKYCCACINYRKGKCLREFPQKTLLAAAERSPSIEYLEFNHDKMIGGEQHTVCKSAGIFFIPIPFKAGWESQ